MEGDLEFCVRHELIRRLKHLVLKEYLHLIDSHLYNPLYLEYPMSEGHLLTYVGNKMSSPGLSYCKSQQ